MDVHRVPACSPVALAAAIRLNEPSTAIAQRFLLPLEVVLHFESQLAKARRLFCEACATERVIPIRKKYYRWHGQVFSREVLRECFTLPAGEALRKVSDWNALAIMVTNTRVEEWAQEIKKIHDDSHFRDDPPKKPMTGNDDDLRAINLGLAEIDIDFDRKSSESESNEEDEQDYDSD